MATTYWAMGYTAAGQWNTWIADFEAHGSPAGLRIGCMPRANHGEYTPAQVGAIADRARAIGMPVMPQLVLRPEVGLNNATSLLNLWSTAVWDHRAAILEQLAATRTPGERLIAIDFEIYTNAVKSQVNLGNGDHWRLIPAAMDGFIEVCRAQNILLYMLPGTEQSQISWPLLAALGTHWWGTESYYTLAQQFGQLSAETAADFGIRLEEIVQVATNWTNMRILFALGFRQHVLRNYAAPLRAMLGAAENCFVFFHSHMTDFGKPSWYAQTDADTTLAGDAATRTALAAQHVAPLNRLLVTNHAMRPGAPAGGGFWS